jgi:molecular chaperone DnaK (HSP70)
MGHKLAIDFGTTNSVIARWKIDGEETEIVRIPGLSENPTDDLPSVVPSLLYVEDGKTGKVVCGQQVRADGLDVQRNNRLFRNFKRGIVASPAPESRTIDDTHPVRWARTS